MTGTSAPCVLRVASGWETENGIQKSRLSNAISVWHTALPGMRQERRTPFCLSLDFVTSIEWRRRAHIWRVSRQRAIQQRLTEALERVFLQRLSHRCAGHWGCAARTWGIGKGMAWVWVCVWGEQESREPKESGCSTSTPMPMPSDAVRCGGELCLRQALHASRFTFTLYSGEVCRCRHGPAVQATCHPGTANPHLRPIRHTVHMGIWSMTLSPPLVGDRFPMRAHCG
jgi:hypothetical protein